MEYWNKGLMEYWSVGVLECWIKIRLSSTNALNSAIK